MNAPQWERLLRWDPAEKPRVYRVELTGDEAAEIRDALAEVAGLRDTLERRLKLLVQAALPLEVLRGQIAVDPYRELSPELQMMVITVTDAIRAEVDLAGTAPLDASPEFYEGTLMDGLEDREGSITVPKGPSGTPEPPAVSPPGDIPEDATCSECGHWAYQHVKRCLARGCACLEFHARGGSSIEAQPK